MLDTVIQVARMIRAGDFGAGCDSSGVDINKSCLSKISMFLEHDYCRLVSTLPDPLRPAGTSPKYDESNFKSSYKIFIVVFEGGRVRAAFEFILPHSSFSLAIIRRTHRRWGQPSTNESLEYSNLRKAFVHSWTILFVDGIQPFQHRFRLIIRLLISDYYSKLKLIANLVQWINQKKLLQAIFCH